MFSYKEEFGAIFKLGEYFTQCYDITDLKTHVEKLANSIVTQPQSDVSFSGRYCSYKMASTLTSDPNLTGTAKSTNHFHGFESFTGFREKNIRNVLQ